MYVMCVGINLILYLLAINYCNNIVSLNPQYLGYTFKMYLSVRYHLVKTKLIALILIILSLKFMSV